MQAAVPRGVSRERGSDLEGRTRARCPGDGVPLAALAQAVELPEAESHASRG